MTTSTQPGKRRGRRPNLTEEAAGAAIDQACRTLRLPSIRADVDEPWRKVRSFFSQT